MLFCCPPAVSDFHFHRRDTDFGAAARWSDKNGEDYTRCCWDDPAAKDLEDISRVSDANFNVLRRRVRTAFAIATEACTPPGNYLYSQPSHLMTALWGGAAGHHHNCAA